MSSCTPADVLRLRDAIDAHLDGRTPHLQSEHRMRHADGTWRWVMTRGLAIRGPDGRPTRMAGSLSDITDRRIAQLRLRHDALHDTLTGLPNRTPLVDRVNQILQRAIRDPQTGGDEFTVLLEDVAGRRTPPCIRSTRRSRSTATSCSSPPACIAGSLIA